MTNKTLTLADFKINVQLYSDSEEEIVGISDDGTLGITIDHNFSSIEELIKECKLPKNDISIFEISIDYVGPVLSQEFSYLLHQSGEDENFLDQKTMESIYADKPIDPRVLELRHSFFTPEKIKEINSVDSYYEVFKILANDFNVSNSLEVLLQNHFEPKEQKIIENEKTVTPFKIEDLPQYLQDTLVRYRTQESFNEWYDKQPIPSAGKSTVLALTTTQYQVFFDEYLESEFLEQTIEALDDVDITPGSEYWDILEKEEPFEFKKFKNNLIKAQQKQEM